MADVGAARAAGREAGVGAGADVVAEGEETCERDEQSVSWNAAERTSGPSSDSGSGTGPSAAQRLDSYFDLMNDSILLIARCKINIEFGAKGRRN